MMTITAHKVLLGLCAALFSFSLVATGQPQMPRSTRDRIAGTAIVKTEQLKGTVLQVEGNHLAVRMSTGEIKTFDVPPSRKFIIDGKELTVGELKPGTRLTATVITKTTPITERTTTVGSGKVWFVSGNQLIVTLPNNENRMYTVNDDYRFTVEGQPATVRDLRKGMVISAQKIVEEPRTEIASDVAVTGEAPAATPPKDGRHPKVLELFPPAPVKREPVQPFVELRNKAALGELPKTAQIPVAALLVFLSIAASLLAGGLRHL
jgi:hypothetical protein